MTRSTPDSATPVCTEGRAYLVSHGGIGSCIELKSGKTLWQKRLSEGVYHASLVAGDGKVYFLGIDGSCTVIESGAKGTVLAVNKMPEDLYYATPAISEGTLYLRGYKRLYAIR